VHQWQSLLRSLSGYEPYRRVYDARIMPERVLEFALKNPDFPRSLLHSLISLSEALDHVVSPIQAQVELQQRMAGLIGELRQLNTARVLSDGSLEHYTRLWLRRCEELARAIEDAYFSSQRPAPAPTRGSSGGVLVPQQQQQQQQPQGRAAR
jgi:uncharacterized alpha-E superfamily protein